MNIKLRVVGSLGLLAQVRREFDMASSPLAGAMLAQGLAANVVHHSDLDSPLALITPLTPTIIIVDATDVDAMNRLGELHRAVAAGAHGQEGMTPVLPQIIAVCDVASFTRARSVIPHWVSDVLFNTATSGELAQRVLLLLKKSGVKVLQLFNGELTLLPSSRLVVCGQAVVRFSPTEFELAELFVSKLGSVVPLPQVRAAFAMAGKSTGANNIRVAIFQLRLKLAEVTNGNLQLVTIYRKGYCLRELASQRPTNPARQIPAEDTLPA